eukprot:5695128-Prymnesium_polylepis.1
MEMWPSSSVSGGLKYAQDPSKEDAFYRLPPTGYVGRSGWFLPIETLSHAVNFSNTMLVEWSQLPHLWRIGAFNTRAAPP